MGSKYLQHNEEVLYSKDDLTMVNQFDVENLKNLSSNNLRKRIRLCTHHHPDDELHEMLIVHKKNTYVRPHKHFGKSESTHIIEGCVDVVLFNDDGSIMQVITMGNFTSGKTFFYRMEKAIFHTLIIRSEVLVFHETTNGPFDGEGTFFAPWSPEETNLGSVINFISEVDRAVGSRLDLKF